MKISKSFKIYIHIIVLSLFSQNLNGAEDFSKNVVIHEKPIAIQNIKFKKFSLAKSTSPITLPNSSPFLSISMLVGRPLSLKVLTNFNWGS